MKLQVILVFRIVTAFHGSQGSTQPFLNQLAVLFRARPPWPNLYPVADSNGNRYVNFGRQNTHPLPSPLIASGSNIGKPGILVSQKKPHFPFFAQPPFKTPAGPQFFGGTMTQAQKFQPGSQFTPIAAAQSNVLQHFNPIMATTSTSTTTTTTTAKPLRHPKVAEDSAQAQTLLVPIQDLQHETPLEHAYHSKNHYSKPPSENTLVSPTAGSEKKPDFRPSPMISEYGGFESERLPPNGESTNHWLESYDAKSSFSASDAKTAPQYESGFKPLSYHQYAAHYGTTASHEDYKNSFVQWNPAPSTIVATATTVKPTPRSTTATTTLSPTPQWVTTTPAPMATLEMTPSERDHGRYYDTEQVRFAPTGSSSERVEDWIKLRNYAASNEGPGSKTKQSKFPVYQKNKPRVRVRPAKCEQFHRYGFCPVTPHYPLSQVERIASRCSALLAHIIAPLPKTEVHYDIVMTRNTSRKTPRLGLRQKFSRSKGWSWKDFKGSPVCDTEEIKITPGWAKNEDGEWLVILQTEIWKQEAQISICSLSHDSLAFQRQLSGTKTKCVQRFTAQRLAVLDPENPDRCPLIRSVFLPSACICLSENTESSLEESTVGSVTPNFSSSEEDKETSGSHEHRQFTLQMPPTGRVSSSEPVMIQNGTFTTTLVVTENSDNTTPSPI